MKQEGNTGGNWILPQRSFVKRFVENKRRPGEVEERNGKGERILGEAERILGEEKRILGEEERRY